MRNTKLSLSMLTLCSLAVTPAISAPDETLGWHGSGEAGYNHQTGNTVSESLLARLRVNYSEDVYDFKSLFEVENKSENNTRTSERYVIDLQGDRYFNQERNFYGFLNARGVNDRFEDIELDYILSAGLGRVLYRTSASRLSAELGLGYRNVEYINAKQNNFDQASVRARGDFDHKFNDIISFHQDLLYIGGEDQHTTETNTGIRAALNSSFSIGASYKFRYNSSPAEGKKKEDGETNLTLMYRF